MSAIPMCIVPRWGDDPFLSQHLAYLSSAPQRYGYSSSVDRGDSSRDSLLSKSSVGGSGEHEVLRELRLLKRLGVTSECISDSIVDQPGRTLQLLVSKNDKSPLISIIPGLPFILSRGNYAIIAPGSNQQQKNWPAVNFAKLIASFKNNMRFILLFLEVQTKCSCAIQLQMLLVVLLCRLQE